MPCSPETGTSRDDPRPGARCRGSLRRRSSSRTRWRDGRDDPATEPHRHRIRRASPSCCASIWPSAEARCARTVARGHGPRGLPRAVRERIYTGNGVLEGPRWSRCAGDRYQLGRVVDVPQRATLIEDMRLEAAPRSSRHRRRSRPRARRRLGDDGPHLPGGRIHPRSPAGRWLVERGVEARRTSTRTARVADTTR